MHSLTNPNLRRPGIRRQSHALSVVLAACLAASVAACSHINFFDDPEHTPKPAVAHTTPAPKPTPAVTPAERAEAKALRTTALEQMRRGAVGPAISNLQRAAKLDPQNKQVQRDLARAKGARRAAVASAQTTPQQTGVTTD